jgi:hypothetical protein
MKKSIYIILGLLVIISLYFALTHRASNFENLSFNLDDTSSITKIIVSDRNRRVDISKLSGQWMINNGFHANQGLVKQLFRLFKNIEIGTIVPDEKIDTTREYLLRTGIKLEFYNGTENAYTCWIGQFDEKKNATLMINDVKLPAYVTAPGLSSNIWKFVSTDNVFWRDRLIFSVDPSQITLVRLDDLNQPENSFVIEKKGTNCQLFDSKHQNVGFQEEKILQYLSYFGNISFESLAEKLTPKEQDSILKLKPLYHISVKTSNGQATDLKLYLKYSDENGKEPDLNYVYGNINKEILVLLIGYFQVDPVLKGIKYFKN